MSHGPSQKFRKIASFPGPQCHILYNPFRNMDYIHIVLSLIAHWTTLRGGKKAWNILKSIDQVFREILSVNHGNMGILNGTINVTGSTSYRFKARKTKAFCPRTIEILMPPEINRSAESMPHWKLDIFDFDQNILSHEFWISLMRKSHFLSINFHISHSLFKWGRRKQKHPPRMDFGAAF